MLSFLHPGYNDLNFFCQFDKKPYYFTLTWIFLVTKKLDFLFDICASCVWFFFPLIKCVFKNFNLGIRLFSELSQNIPRWQSLGNHGFKAGFNFHASKQLNSLVSSNFNFNQNVLRNMCFLSRLHGICFRGPWSFTLGFQTLAAIPEHCSWALKSPPPSSTILSCLQLCRARGPQVLCVRVTCPSFCSQITYLTFMSSPI